MRLGVAPAKTTKENIIRSSKKSDDQNEPPVKFFKITLLTWTGNFMEGFREKIALTSFGNKFTTFSPSENHFH